MNELLFPVVGAMLVFCVVVPLLTLAAKCVATFLRAASDEVSAQESPSRFLFVVGPTLGPIVWLISASIHQSEEGTQLTACLVDHFRGAVCRDVVLFAVFLFSILGLVVLWRVRLDSTARSERTVVAAARGGAEARIRSVCRQNTTLTGYLRCIRVVERGVAPVCTRGLFRPHVEIEAELVRRLDDDELTATLLHEVEHAHAQDPLRFFVANVALSINPLGSLLASELARYHFAREALCDRRAVQRGADPFALARTIVSVAAPIAAPASTAALGGAGIGGVRLRVQLLLGYAAAAPGPAQRTAPVGLVTTLVVLVAVAPHLMGAGPLDVLHYGIERAALLLGLG